MPANITFTEIDFFVKIFNKLCKKVGLQKLSLQLSEIPNAKDINIFTVIENEIDEQLYQLFGEKLILKDDNAVRRYRGVQLQMSIIKIVLINKFCNYTHGEIAKIMNEARSIVSRKISMFNKAQASDEIKNGKDYDFNFTAKLFKNYSKIESEIQKKINNG